MKGLPGLERDRAGRIWPELERPTREVRGRTLLIAGLGGIGVEVARLAAAFGMRVIGVRELAERADDMVVTLPGTPATRGLVDAATRERWAGQGRRRGDPGRLPARRRARGRRARCLRARAAAASEPAVEPFPT